MCPFQRLRAAELQSGESIGFCRKMVKGGFKSMFPPLGMAVVDVEDVAATHILAALNPKAEVRVTAARAARALCLGLRGWSFQCYVVSSSARRRRTSFRCA